MWRNTEVDAFIDWLRQHNEQARGRSSSAGFYGLDIYNMSGSIAAVLDYLDKVDPRSRRGGARALRLPDALAEGTRRPTAARC